MPEVPSVSGTPGLTAPASGLAEAVREVFAEHGSLARSLKGFEPRDGQRRMAEAVASILDAGGKEVESLNQAVRLIRGPAGGKVEIEIFRKGSEEPVKLVVM